MGKIVSSPAKESTTVDQASADAKSNQAPVAAVVWIEGVKKDRPFEGSARISQSGAKFDPGFLAVPAGQTVEMPNDDSIAHNVFSYSDPKQFNLGIYPKGESKKVVFDKPGKVDVFCSIHRQMHAVIYVVPSKWYSEVDSSSAFKIGDVPAGEYTVKAWRDGYAEIAQKVTIPEKGELKVEFVLDKPLSE